IYTGGGGGGNNNNTNDNNNDGGDDDDTGGGDDENNGGGDNNGDDDTGNTDDGESDTVPPAPSNPGGSLIPGDNGIYVEFGNDGVPLGEWRWDEDAGQWIYDEYPPLSENLPQTGDALPAGFAHLWILPLLSLLWFGFARPRLRRRSVGRAR
ncbi:MAG: hypothetical protein LBE16_00660, partial [Clostridiales Family XIII bacterium]|nr:hypothetical protein [Clostridiales Family XIII bacterium]